MSISLIDGPKLRKLFKFLRRSRLNVYLVLLVKGILERFLGRNFKFRRLNMVAVGQSHLDAAWRWTKRQGIVKARATFKKALDHIDELPEFTFAQPSPAYYQWMKDHFPDIFERIKVAVKRGRWILMGGMWVEADANIPSGESLVRQRLYGMRFFRDEFGKMPQVEFLQDCFGFNWNLPQILAKSGALIFGTGKVPFWNQTNKGTFPSGILRWMAPDGTVLPTVLIYFGYLLPITYGKDYPDLYRLLKPEHADFIADYGVPLEEVRRVQSAELMLDNIFGFGLGDGGHGPVEAEIAIVQALRTLYPRKFRFYRQGDFVTLLQKHFPRWLTWRDEIYLELHRGTYTTHGRVKRSNRDNEVLLEVNEKLQTFSSLFGRPPGRAELERHWKLLLFNQFHDIIPGSSIPEVYDDAYADYEVLYDYNRNTIRSTLEYLGGMAHLREDLGTPVIVFNALSWEHDTPLELDTVIEGEIGAVFDSQGNPLPFQVTTLPSKVSLGKNARKVTAILPNTPPHGITLAYISKGGHSGVDPVKLGAKEVVTAKKIDGVLVLENDLIRASIDARSGYLTSLFDKQLGREALSRKSGVVRLYRELKGTDAWNIDPDYQDNLVQVPEEANEVTISQEGPVVASVVVKRLVNESTFCTTTRLYAGSKVLVFSLDVDWKEKNTIFKLEFSPAVDFSSTNTVTAEIPYAHIDRPIRPRTRFDRERWEYSCQKWVDLSDGEVGFSVVNNSKYGFSVSKDRILLSVLRGPEFPSCAKETLYIDCGDSSRPKYTDQHFHRGIEFGVFLHEGTWRQETWRRAHEFNYPLFAAPITQPMVDDIPTEKVLELPLSFLEVTPSNVQLVVVKSWEDSTASDRVLPVVLRLVEMEGEHSTVRVQFHQKVEVVGAKVVNLLEMDPRPLPVPDKDGFVVEVGPHEIKTILAELMTSW
ncbi:MAG: alpha-mannosidase [Promethearchaeota archaeon]